MLLLLPLPDVLLDTMLQIRTDNKEKRGFALRTYPARAFGLILAGIAFTPVFMEIGHALWVWVAFGLYIMLWPQICYLYCSIRSDSVTTAKYLLSVDAFCCGLIVAAAYFGLMPSAILMTMVALNNISTGGVRFMALGLLLQILGVAAGIAVFGWEPQFQNSLMTNAASIPTLLIYPLMIGWLNYRFAIRIHHQNKQLQEFSRTDGLTGLLNRRYWQVRAIEEFDRCHRYGHAATLIMIDIDHFKNINDSHGHWVGDEVLRRVAKTIQKQLRNLDITGRYGGEEFSVILINTDIEQGKKVAERMRVEVENRIIGEAVPMPCTISLGLAAFDRSMPNIDDWIKAADSALYDAKKQGRNRCCVFTGHFPASKS